MRNKYVQCHIEAKHNLTSHTNVESDLCYFFVIQPLGYITPFQTLR